jgi:hypothetical protein
MTPAPSQLQIWIDRLWLVSGQRWLLVALSLVCVAGASTITALAAGSPPGVAPALLAALAVVAVIRPDSHSALVVEVAVVWQWLATTDDLTTPWVVPFAVLLFVFHCTIALMAVTPIAAHVQGVLLLRWLRRTAWVTAATIGVWTIVVLADQRRARGSAALTVVGFVVLTGLIAITRERSTPRHDRSS